MNELLNLCPSCIEALSSNKTRIIRHWDLNPIHSGKKCPMCAGKNTYVKRFYLNVAEFESFAAKKLKNTHR